MENRTINNIKLGAFVSGGLLFLVVLLYMIGANRSLFGATYILKARFENVQGLVSGNNVRFSGIQAGTVKNIQILNDTVIEVVMIVDKKMQAIIRTNALVSIGTDGLVGNKVVNMVPSKVSAPLAKEGAILLVKRAVSTDEMLQTLYTTNNDIAVIAANLKMTVQRINTSTAIWTLLSDPYIPNDLKLSIAKIREATSKAASITNNLDEMIVEVKNGKGLLGMILTDDTLANNFGNVVLKINSVGEQLDTLSGEIRGLVNNFNQDLNKGKGPFNTLLRDSMLSIKLSNSLDNIQQGTDGFNQNMAAIKHSFLLRGYFKKMRKKELKNNNK
jgi:phospholipid/cholesterol/gamma-HCH transport system substrate-binding protein